MKRVSINNFMGGIINAADPTLIPDNACVEMENYEYRDSLYPRKRMAVITSELDSAVGIHALGTIRAIAVWNPRIFPLGCSGDRIYLFAAGTRIYVCYKVATVFPCVPLFTGVNATSTISFYVSQERVIIADSASPGRYVSINSDREFVVGTLGIEAPRYMPSVSLAGADNSYASIAESDTGMSIERGNMLQYCYTVEDKYGVESNPSPIHTCHKLAFKHLDVAPPGFKYYWFQTKISGLSISQYDATLRERLKYYNIYRRDVDYREGVNAKQFVMVKRLPVTANTSAITTDSSNDSLADISYDRNVSPMASLVTENSGVVYLGNIVSTTAKFPFLFDKYVEITIMNDNDQDYVRPIISLRITREMCGYASDELNRIMLDGYRSKIRLFFSDMITPLPVMYKEVHDLGATIIALDCYVTIPYVNRTSSTKLYLCIAETEAGVTDATWDSFTYGKFFDYAKNHYNDQWADQIIFDINRPISVGHHICANVAYALAPTDSRRVMFNLANQTKLGHIYHHSGSQTDYTDGNDIMLVSPFGDDLEINHMSYVIDKDYYVKYDLIKMPKKPALIYFDGFDAPCDQHLTEFPYQALILCGTFYFSLVYNSAINGVKAYYKAGASPWTALFSFPNLLGEWAGVRIRLFLHVAQGRLYYRYYAYSVDGFGTEVTGDNFVAISTAFDFDDEVLLNKDLLSHNDAPAGVMYKVMRFDFVETPTLTDDEIERLADSYWRGATFFKSPIGATTANVFANEGITSEVKTITTESNKNMVVWSDINGNSFPALNSKLFREEVQVIDVVPSYMRMQYQNTIVVLTRNTLNRIVLSDDLQSMATAAVNEIEEFPSGGIFAKGSYVNGGGHLFWLSEMGVIMYGSDGAIPISKDIITIPIHQNYIGTWIDRYGQYVLHDKTYSISYVYHVYKKAWTIFTGLDISLVSKIQFGNDVLNKVLIVSSTGTIREYPGVSVDTTCTHKITTKRFPIGNQRVSRYRLIHDTTTGTRSITAKTYNHFLSATELSSIAINPPRYEWIMLPINFWGEYLQFYIDNLDAITSIDIDIKEGV